MFSEHGKLSTNISNTDIRENIHQKIAGRSRFYKNVGYSAVADGKVC